MKEAIDDIKRFSQHDFDFHIALAGSTGNEMIHEMMKRILKKVFKEYEYFQPKALFQVDEAILTAEQIVSCVVEGEEEKAAGFMRDHLNLVTTELKRMMPGVEWSKGRRL